NNFLPEPENIIENGCLEDDYKWHQTGLTDNKMNEDKDLVNSLQPIKLCESESSASDNTLHTIDFRYLPRFRISNIFTPILQKSKKNKVANNIESQPAIVNLYVTKRHGRPLKQFK
ncbi:14444_t:CDS:2, partial [Racocetra persica]